MSALPHGRHTATILIEDEDLRVEITCHAGPNGHCRQICAEPDCFDEQFRGMAVTPDGWTHLHYTYDAATDRESEVLHRMEDGGYCNVVEFIAQDGRPQEFYEGPTARLNDTEIDYRWDGDNYLWSPRETGGAA